MKNVSQLGTYLFTFSESYQHLRIYRFLLGIPINKKKKKPIYLYNYNYVILYTSLPSN